MLPQAVEVSDLRKHYRLGETLVEALRGVSVSVHPGEFVSIIGPSGSGKSTLLHCIGGLDRQTAGEVIVGGTTLSSLSEEALTIFRRRNVGVVFQFFNLLPDLSVEDKVAVPLMLDGVKMNDVHSRVAEALEVVRLTGRRHHMPGELSGGEMQRAAVARALVVKPALVLADEPTGNLDSENGSAILHELRRACTDFGHTVMMVTHDRNAAALADRVVELRDGRVVGI
jgi:putative ABC transport system ATP-binding protein